MIDSSFDAKMFQRSTATFIHHDDRDMEARDLVVGGWAIKILGTPLANPSSKYQSLTVLVVFS